ncbi:glucan endo-1,3-beta-glucosidase-like [Abrus precatorius]|uniref:glucan endo-1,3-beta-D-glucosidase n=1 Tax=Abrus precatorius TaxID=3816 RepID=A0A8B8LYH1_ABRPR|nr:glucan endo-1,3-beta-glucosidase-like [Abrus precatorius]
MIFALLLLVLSGLKTTAAAQTVGVCYGRVAKNLPPAQEVIDICKENGIGRMRIYEPDPLTIQALRGSNIELLVGVPNEQIHSLSVEAIATDWVQNNIQNHSRDVKFRYIVVGNEIKPDETTAQFVLPAMQNIYAALVSANLQSQIKVSTAIELSLLGSSYPPSVGAFTPSSCAYMKSIVNFLVKNGAPLLVNVYTYFSYIGDPKNISLSYALFTSPTVVVKDGGYEYKNLFDASLGALYAGLEKVGASDLEIVVSESGWPSSGGIGASEDNAQVYYKNLINHVVGGTPKRPNHAVETYLFAMFDEDQKGIAETKRNFGLFTPNKQPKYRIQFTNSPHRDEGFSPRVTGEGIFFLSFFILLVVLLIVRLIS